MFGEGGRNLSSRNTVLKFTCSKSKFYRFLLEKNSVRTETNHLDRLFDLTCTRIFVNGCGLNLRNFAQLGNYFHLPPVCDKRERKMA